MLAPSLTSWSAQYHRLLRSYDRLQQPHRGSVEYDDALQHYFQDCWHLKDWIKNDPTVTLSVSIEKAVQQHLALQVVADLANAAKHLVRHTHREGAYITSTNVSITLGSDQPAEFLYVVTLSDGTTLSAQDLVHEALEAWKTVLATVGLQP